MRKLISILTIAVSLTLNQLTFGQCPDPQLFDLQLLQTSSEPVWVNNIENQSSPDEFTLELYSPEDIHNYTINFGDGSPVTSGELWAAGTPLSHTYSLGKYTITLSETKNGCTRTIKGTLINDRKPGASAIPPTDNSSGCVPHSLKFVNQTTNASPFTKFVWDWGDGNIEHADANSVGKQISHVYQKGKAGCNMTVKLTAISLSDSSFSTYGPYDMWDVDSTAIAASAVEICSGDTITFTDVTLYNCNKSARRIKWDLSQVGGPITPWLANTPQNKVQKAWVNGPVGSTFTVFLADSNICGVRSSAITVRIIDSPKAQIQPEKLRVCVDEPIVFKNITTGPSSRYRWNLGDNTGWRNTNNKNNITYAYNRPGTYTVNLIAEVAGSLKCSDTTSVDIEVLQSPIAKFSSDSREGCNPLEVNVTNQSANANSYKWYLDDKLISEAETPGRLSLNKPGVFELKLVAANAVGCEDFSSTTFYSYPQLNPDAEVESGCRNSNIQVFDRSTLGPGSQNNQASNCATGKILKEHFDNMGGPEVSLRDIAAMPPLAENSSLLSNLSAGSHKDGNFATRIRGYICPPKTGDYTFWISADGEAELWLSTDEKPENKTRLAFLNQGVGVGEYDKHASQRSQAVYLTPGKRVYIEVLYKKNGIKKDHLSVGWQIPGTATRELPIKGEYLSPFTSGGGITSWQWDFGDGIGTSTAQNPEYTYSDTGDFVITLTASSGRCNSTKTFPITIYPAPKAAFSVSDTVGCGSLKVNLVNQSLNATNYTLFMDDAVSPLTFSEDWESLDHTFSNETNEVKKYSIKLVSEGNGGCKDSVMQEVIVHPTPLLDFDYAPKLPQCSPANIKFSASGNGFKEFTWFFGNSEAVVTKEKSIEFDFVNRTTGIKYDTVTLLAVSDGGCVARTSKVIASYPEVFPEINIEGAECSGSVIRLSTEERFTSYLWDLGDGNKSSKASPENVYVNTTSEPVDFKVLVRAQNAFGCYGETERTITVSPKPSASFTFLQPPGGCTPLRLDILNTSSKENGEEYIWNFGGEDESKHEVEFEQAWINDSDREIYQDVKLLVHNQYGCTDTASEGITIYPKPKANFEADKYIGCSPLEVAFTNLSSGANAYSWIARNNSVVGNQEHLDHIFSNTTEADEKHELGLIAISDKSCRDTIYQEVTVIKRPVAMFDLSSVNVFAGDTILINNRSENGESFLWTYGDGSSSVLENPLQHIYTEDGNFEMELLVANDYCADSISREVSVTKVPPIAEFAGSGTGCGSITITFINKSKHANHFIWDFDNNNTLETTTNSDVTYTFYNYSKEKKTFNVSLTAIGPGGQAEKIEFDAVVLMPLPQVDFSPRPQTVYIPNEVTFVNETTNAVSYEWDFGNGETSSLMEPVYSYEEEGLYDIILTATNEWGCSASKKLPAAVEAKEGGRLVMPNAFTPRTGGSGGNMAGSGLNDVFLPGFFTGVEEYSLLIFNKWGALIFESDNVDIGWDGYYENQLCEEGVYVYKVKARFKGGNVQEIIGDVTLLRGN